MVEVGGGNGRVESAEQFQFAWSNVWPMSDISYSEMRCSDTGGFSGGEGWEYITPR